MRYDDEMGVYTRYRTGEEELHNESTDPHRLHNLAGDQRYAGRLTNLRNRFSKVWRDDGLRWRPNLP